jgi:hypothetical protein
VADNGLVRNTTPARVMQRGSEFLITEGRYPGKFGVNRGVVRDTGFEYVVFTEKNSLFDPKVTKR